MGVAAAATSHASGARKSSKGSKDNSINVEDTPIRLAVTFAPSRARIMGAQNNYIFNRQPRRMSDCLYVMANHGVLLEYALDPIPDSSKPKRYQINLKSLADYSCLRPDSNTSISFKFVFF